MVIEELRHKFSLKVLLKVSKLSKSTYEYYKSDKHLKALDKRQTKDNEILAIFRPIYIENKTRYGYRRMILSIDTNTLNKLGVGRDRIRKVLSINNLKGVQGRNHKYHSYKGDNGLDKMNLLLSKEYDEVKKKDTYIRHFTASKPNEIWTTDVSEFKFRDKKLYLSPIMDLYDSSIISYDISYSPNLEQVHRMLNKAFNKYTNLESLIFHSDQGWQYQHTSYINSLASRGIRQSFSRKGNCMDNSPMENFFGILKNEMYYGHEKEFNSIEELKQAISDYIDNYYNTKRINIKRKGLSPFEYRQKSLSLVF